MKSPSTVISQTRHSGKRGSVLVIVLWICFGLVALVIYFANSMSAELRAADNRVMEGAARTAVAGGARYAAYVLKTYSTSGSIPLSTDYKSEGLAVGDAYFWFIGRDNNQDPTTEPAFGLVDEASKLNLNTASLEMLLALPGMTSDLAASIIAWRTSSSSTSTSSSGGATDDTYARLNPPRTLKGANFESVDELRLVYGATLEILLGEDTNRNGALDPNEDDNTKTPPNDNQNGSLLPGILEYVTVYSSQPNTNSSGSRRINVKAPAERTALYRLLTQKIPQRAASIMTAISGRTINSVAEFYAVSGMTEDEYTLIRAEIGMSNGTTSTGLINVNTASAAVLACIPGISASKATEMATYRLAHTELTTFTWITQILDQTAIAAAGPYITDQSYQFSADIAGAARSGRGYCREKFVFDMTTGTPRIVYRQDLTAYGWALGSQARQTLKETPGGNL